MQRMLGLITISAVLGLGACSKENVEPDQDTKVSTGAALQNTTWRMTAYDMEFGAQNSTARRTVDFFRSYSYSQATPCLGQSTITFGADGKLVWNRENQYSCGIRWPFDQSQRKIDWGTWSVPQPTALMIDGPQHNPGNSSLPVMEQVKGSYTIEEVSQTKLVLTSTFIIGRYQDSIRVDRAVFARVP